MTINQEMNMNGENCNIERVSGNRMPASALATISPRADIQETKDSLILVSDMPGVTNEGLEISLERNTLTITGQVTSRDEAGLKALHTEFRPALYRRSFVLSDAVDRERIEATIKDGVLKVVLPKSDNLKPRKIAVRSDAN
jgi:HSP20 family molecular chaperone IbpA